MTQASNPIPALLNSAHAVIRKVGYECEHFCLRAYSTHGRLLSLEQAGGDGTVTVGVAWPGVAPVSYPIANGEWMRRFEHDLRCLRFDRRSRMRRVAA